MTVWSIAGSDSGGGAGIQADLNTFHDFKVHGCTVITALTAQNTLGVTHIQATSLENLQAQLIALKSDLKPRAIKLGMLYDAQLVTCIAHELKDLAVPIIADPVLVSTSGCQLFSDDFIEAYKKNIFPLATLLTPNIHEAEALTGIQIHDFQDMEKAAQLLLTQGVQAVLIKGGDFDHQDLASDFYADSTEQCWINQNRVNTVHSHGTGCTLSSAIAANIALGWTLIDSIIIAKAYVHAGLTHAVPLGQGRNPISHVGAGSLKNHFPWVTAFPQALAESFKKITQPIGFYPIVDNLSDLKKLCTKGIAYIQLRIKNPGDNFDEICEQALKIAGSFGVNLIVNDQVGKGLGAHLGQEDLIGFNVETDRDTFLGLSAHNLLELAKAYAYYPSYLAMGPIFDTESKSLNYACIGLDKLKFIASICPLPLVAIGGIDYEIIPEIIALGCSGVAFIGTAKKLMQEGRYDRHFALPHFSIESQQKLLQSKIVCVGAGGLAAGFLPCLAAAGVGSITMIDDDLVSYSNLQRQVLFQEKDLGKSKVETAAGFLSGLNSQIKITAINDKLTPDNAIELLTGFDLILDGTDNYGTHYLINDTARYLKTKLIAASVFQDQGQLYYLSPESACYRCAFPVAPGVDERPNCNLAGILGTTPAMLGLMQAQLAIQLIIDNKYEQESFCRTVDMSTWRVKKYQFKPDLNCSCCKTELSLNSLRRLHMQIDTITPEALKESMDAGFPVNLLDVREDHERETYNIGGHHIPIQELPERIYELDPTLPYVVYCHSGGRSSMACEFLVNQGFKVKNLVGGMKAWQAL